MNSPLQNPDYFKKKSLMSPRLSEQPGYKSNNPASMKRSSYYQYEMEHNNFPLSNEFIIAEDELEDSPKNFNKKGRKFPNFE
jgi:hypothetical protein